MSPRTIQTDDVLSVLRTIDDPEMPISIVDLGLVVQIRGCEPAREPCENPGKHLPIEIDLTPTFIGCPALDMIADLVESRVVKRLNAAAVRVRWVNSPPWSPSRISEAGRERLRQFGVSVPDARTSAACEGQPAQSEAALVSLTIDGLPVSVPCPYCGSARTAMESPFGPTRCRMIYYCNACRNAFERMKPI